MLYKENNQPLKLRGFLFIYKQTIEIYNLVKYFDPKIK